MLRRRPKFFESNTWFPIGKKKFRYKKIYRLMKHRFRYDTGSGIIPDPVSYRNRYHTGSSIIPEPVSYRIQYHTGSSIIPEPVFHKPVSYRIQYHTGTGVS
ncbi:hypothetical protein AVEN_100396-1 [Araneus ventricosus]|uniref:Uncharacterized protein n=1 Tax=Araneus ventricosus TaxID=182803 RepID=A0A4Y2NCL2_ARAVE|nr:hypothetical protein AVEN_100396-1 [Araneus ventricosus]